MIEKIKELCSAVVADMEKAKDGNRAAGRRARVATSRLEKLFKEFRKESVNWGKE